jgi:DNA mismatch repair protein MutS2
MSLAPLDDGLDAIEFPAVLDVVAGHAAGELAAADLRSRRPSTEQGWIERELAYVGELLAVLRRGDAIDLPAVPDIRSALGRLRLDGAVLELAELAALRATLTAGRTVATELERLADACPRVSGLRAPPVDRAVERQLERAVGDDGELLDTASPALAAARREVHVARERLVRRLETLLRDLDGSGGVTMRAGRYVIPVRRDARGRPDGIIHDESASAGTLFIEPTVAIPLGNALREALVAEERAVLQVLRDLTEALRPVREVIRALHAVAVETDTILARARWARDCAAEVPRITGLGGGLRLTEARHPLLLARGIAVVPFDLVLEGPERTLLISGPNTGGKTVLLKATGLMIALAQCGIVPPVGAESALPILTRTFVDIGDHQSLQADLSTFSAHVAELRRILEGADHTTLVILDEVGSGTDPAEGGALAMAVLETLTRRGVLTLATTHLGALKGLATRVPGVVNGSLHFDAATLSPTYRFTKGIPGRSYGLAIARRLGVDPAVLAAAEQLVPDAERELDRLLATVEAREQELARREATVIEQAADLERREAVAAMTADAQAAREAALRQEEKEATRERARQAKAYLLEARKRVEAALSLAQGAGHEASAREARRLVEEGIRAEAEQLEEPEAQRAAGPGTQLVVGARVRLTTGAIGEVGELRGDGRAVVVVGAMRLVVKAATLVVLRQEVVARTVALPRGDDPVRTAATEIDLRGMRVDEAMPVVLAALDAAVLAEEPELRVIHGMGTGALRDAVRAMLQRDNRVASLDFAIRQQGGTGVTVAVLR